MKPQKKIQKEILNLITRQFKLDIELEHGISHWKRVKEIGNYLAKHTKADLKVINLFAYLHDSKRENENHDPEHGLRASFFIKELYNKDILNISQKQLNQLSFACEHHNNSKVKSDDITIQTCWDADRLDLWRIGVIPELSLLNTAIAKQEETIELAWKLGRK
ncbi:hypothetical protein KAU40_00570 [Candidatus Parcubacteria bacterium]|nr:hypothetical protein [Candidatus Parcubacteria bacterium]